MLDYEVYLEKFAIFGRLLRSQGLDVTHQETADAARIMISLGDLSNREAVKHALRLVYAKSRDDQLKFDRVFDSFFLSEERIRAIDRRHKEEEIEKAKEKQAAEELLRTERNATEYDDSQLEAFASLPEEEKERLQRIKDKYLNDPKRNPDLYAGFIHSVFARSIMEQQMAMEDAAVGAGPVDPEIGLMFKDISSFSDNEIPKAVYYVQTIARQINSEHMKKRKKGARSSTLDFRRTIRRALETGGNMYRLYYKKKSIAKKQLVILCDVSGSMIQFSEFVLRFIQSLNQTSENSRVFLFSEDVYEADNFALHDMDRFREYVRSTGVYGRGTKLGSALKTLNDMNPAALNPSTMLLIITDSKTVDTDDAEHEILRARGKAGRVFIMNPIPQRKWKYSQTIGRMEKLVPMISCSTLDELGAACRKLTFM